MQLFLFNFFRGDWLTVDRVICLGSSKMLRVWFATQLRLFGGSSGLLELACVNCLHTNVPRPSTAEFEWYHKHWSHTRSVITYKREEAFLGEEEEEEKRVSPQRYTYHTQCSKSWKKCAWIFLQKKNRVKKYFNIIFICCATFYSFFSTGYLSSIIVLTIILN